ncbi:MAG: Rpn family recombination-promoting nuclease/putative transposase [Oscillospiraceae bacterium]|nr:Rpn family recombination-promoting nuclease/putative transposase [Oscillospiraceae bacterium]
MVKKMLSVKNDLIFKHIFGSPDSQDILESFLKSILDIPDEEYEVLTLYIQHSDI